RKKEGANLQRLAGKIALVTGAGSGIGRAIARALASEGASVGCMDIDGESAEATAAAITGTGGSAHAEAGDVSRSEAAQRAIRNLVQRFGSLHVLVNNAAVFLPDGTLADIEEEMFDRAMAVNIGGVFRMSRFAIPEI